MTLLTDRPLRPSQEKILEYSGGLMGISAVPGSGKTFTLSLLAANIIEKGWLQDDQEILVVTLVNSAVENFYRRISQFVEQSNLIPNIGYRVRTLHGLAHDIVRERPELAGLDENFQILDEREGESIVSEIVHAWLRSQPNALEDYLDSEAGHSNWDQIRRNNLPEMLKGIAQNAIRYAKDHSWTPAMMQERVEQLPLPLPLAEICVSFYSDYQRSLVYRGAVDFDDLIRLALSVLQQDPLLCERLSDRWPYILEDEAQDSSELQERILSKLAEKYGNWVRVGDPNQAIYETFTTANPIFLRNFINRPDVIARDLPNSGRSTQSIITLANYLVEWTMLDHPLPEVRDALHAPPCIRPVLPDDPQQNPSDDPAQVQLFLKKLTPASEIAAVAESIARWLPNNLDKTVAVLTPRNHRAFELVDEFKRRKISYCDDLLKSSSSTRLLANDLGDILRCLSDPQSQTKLARVYQILQLGEETEETNDGEESHPDKVFELLKKCPRVEEFLWPTPERDWLEETGIEDHNPEAHARLVSFRQSIQRWQNSVLLPVDQVVLTISQDIYKQPAKLALAHKIALLLKQTQQAHPGWRLSNMAEELLVIGRNERRFIGFNDSDTGFDPDEHKGQVVVSTVHKAKGMEWDRVYLMSVNNYDFPSGLAHDTFISERWFIRNGLNLEAEALAQLEQLMTEDPSAWYEEGNATGKSRTEYIKERLRLLYVGITRARREIILTWNTGKGRVEQQPAIPFVALADFYGQEDRKPLKLCEGTDSL